MILHLLHALPGCLVIGLMVFDVVASWPGPTWQDQIKAANRRMP